MSNSGPELLFPVHTDLIDLPSKGRFYSIDHPLCGQNSIEIGQMRGVEEDILTNRDYIKKDLVIDKLLSSLIQDSKLKEDRYFSKILVADQSAMILNARITAYTWEYPVALICPRCGESVKFCFDLRKYTVKDPDYQDDDRVVYNENDNTFDLTLPDTEITVKVNLSTIGIQRKLRNKLLGGKKKDLNNKDQLEDIIVSINGSNDVRLIDSFFKTIPAYHLNWFKSTLDDINPSLSLIQNFECSSCGHSDDIEPPFSTDFLFPPKLKKKKQ